MKIQYYYWELSKIDSPSTKNEFLIIRYTFKENGEKEASIIATCEKQENAVIIVISLNATNLLK